MTFSHNSLHMKFKYMSVDIEVVPSETRMPDSEKDPIIIISMYFYPAFNGKNSIVLAAKKLRQSDTDTLGFFNEKEMLNDFLKVIDRFDPDIILGYNINNFDLPYIETRLRKNGLPRTIGRCNQKPIFLWWLWFVVLPWYFGNNSMANSVRSI